MLGNAASAWERLTSFIRNNYEIDEFWNEGKATHKHYNLLFFKRGGKSLIILSLREKFFYATVVLGAKEREKFEEQRGNFSQELCRRYDTATTLHDGKWLYFELYDELFIDDIIHLLLIKRKPNRKVVPRNRLASTQLDIGLSHQEITKIIMN